MIKRILLAVGAAVFLVAIPIGTTLASEGNQQSEDLQDFFPWLSKPGGLSENWAEGLAHFGIGLAGALVTVYLFLGEFLPSMGGKAEYELKRQELEDLKKRKDRARTELEKYAKGEVEIPEDRRRTEESLSDDLRTDIEGLERQIGRERWRLFLLGFPIYLLLGGFFASALAVNVIQALAIGFGWTAIADRFGLQKELQVKGVISQEQINRLEAQGLEAAKDVTKLEAENANLRKAVETATLSGQTR